VQWNSCKLIVSEKVAVQLTPCTVLLWGLKL